MKKYLIAAILIFSALYGGFRGAGFRGNWTSPWYSTDSLYSDVAVIGGAYIGNHSIYFTDTNTVADTALYIYKYGAKTNGYGIVVNMDTSSNTAANVIGIDFSGSNAINNSSDYFWYGNAYAYLRGDNTFGIQKVAILTADGIVQSSNHDLSVSQGNSKDMIFSWSATKKGDFIIRDGNNIANANVNGFQYQDSAATIQVAFSNGGVVSAMGGFNYAADTGSTDAYKLVMPNITALVTGLQLTFKAVTANTGAATLTINALSATALKSLHDVDPPDNYIEAGSMVMCVYDGTNFQILSPDANP